MTHPCDSLRTLSLPKPSLHYHFPTKADLGRALIRRYAEAFDAALQRIESQADDALDRYVQLWRAPMRTRRASPLWQSVCWISSACVADAPGAERTGAAAALIRTRGARRAIERY
jgi:AcrR family transcriptional regulator